MIFITGGASQGKTTFAGNFPDRYIIDDLHETIRNIIDDGKDPDGFVRELVLQNPDAVIIMDEVGSGIVPVNERDRVYREAVGRAGQYLAGAAEEVYRVICGIGVKLK